MGIKYLIHSSFETKIPKRKIICFFPINDSMDEYYTMLKLLYGIHTNDDGGTVRFKTPNMSLREADNLLENVLFSTHIFGQNNKHDVAFTIPVMYLPAPYSHGRIYFKFISKEENFTRATDDDESDELSEKFPITVSLFVSFANLSELTDTEDLDKKIWNTLKFELTEEMFNSLENDIEEILNQ